VVSVTSELAATVGVVDSVDLTASPPLLSIVGQTIRLRREVEAAVPAWRRFSSLSRLFPGPASLPTAG
jgi:hypothetical protein